MRCDEGHDPGADRRVFQHPLAVHRAGQNLEAPVARVTGWDVPYPPAALEQAYLPSVDRIVEAVRTTVAY